jgi:U4/U6.U5 tri-snRNP-associated protein 2
MKKFDGATWSDDIKAGRRRFRVTRLPRFLLLHMRRFTKNNFFVEKNPTIVNFPVKNLELRDVLPVPPGAGTSKYDLISNIVHEGKAAGGAYRAHVHRRVEGTWYEAQDLTITDVLPQMVALSEAYLQIYARQDEPPPGAAPPAVAPPAAAAKAPAAKAPAAKRG